MNKVMNKDNELVNKSISRILGSFKDKNGMAIGLDDDVIVPEPNETDIHICSFTGFVDDILENGNIIVSDSEGDSFEIEAERLELIN